MAALLVAGLLGGMNTNTTGSIDFAVRPNDRFTIGKPCSDPRKTRYCTCSAMLSSSVSDTLVSKLSTIAADHELCQDEHRLSEEDDDEIQRDQMR